MIFKRPDRPLQASVHSRVLVIPTHGFPPQPAVLCQNGTVRVVVTVGVHYVGNGCRPIRTVIPPVRDVQILASATGPVLRIGLYKGAAL